MKFNHHQYSLRKKAFNDNVRGYSQENTRAFELCIKCKRDEGKEASEAWNECLEEYQDKTESNWNLEQHSKLKSNLS